MPAGMVKGAAALSSLSHQELSESHSYNVGQDVRCDLAA